MKKRTLIIIAAAVITAAFLLSSCAEPICPAYYQVGVMKNTPKTVKH